VQDTVVEAVYIEEVGEPLLEGAGAIRISTRTARLLASLGRFGVVLLPVYALGSRYVEGVGTALVVALAISLVWALAMRSAFLAARPTLLALGPGVAAGLGTATGFVPVCALALVLPKTFFHPVVALEMAGAVFVLSAAWETLVYRSIAMRQRVLVVGAADGGTDLVEDIELAAGAPFELVGLVDDDLEQDQFAGVPVHGRVADLARVVEAQRPDIVVLAVSSSRADAFEHLLDVAGLGFKVVGLPEFYEHAFGRVPVRHLSAQWFMSVLHLYRAPTRASPSAASTSSWRRSGSR
jgi:FlaA1/EpsC-like NDP-sugar epimerase